MDTEKANKEVSRTFIEKRSSFDIIKKCKVDYLIIFFFASTVYRKINNHRLEITV